MSVMHVRRTRMSAVLSRVLTLGDSFHRSCDVRDRVCGRTAFVGRRLCLVSGDPLLDRAGGALPVCRCESKLSRGESVCDLLLMFVGHSFVVVYVLHSIDVNAMAR